MKNKCFSMVTNGGGWGLKFFNFISARNHT